MGPIAIEEQTRMSKRIVRDTTSSGTGPALSPTAILDAPIPDSLIPHSPKPDSVSGSRDGLPAPTQARKLRAAPPSTVRHFASFASEEHQSNRQAETFYLQKQIQLQTQMVFVLEDGSRIQGVIEWYDRNSIKVRGKSRALVYKSAIKYLYKAGEVGSGPGE